MRYENPYYMTEDMLGAADLISGGRLQLGISRRLALNRSSTVGAISATNRRTVERMRTWAVATARSFSICCVARDSHARIRGRCFQIRRDCFASNRTQRDCAIASGGAPRPTRLQCGLQRKE